MSLEVRRLQALNDYAILNTPPHPAFDSLTAAATLALDAPIGLVSLIDAERQWFKSVIGLELTETPRTLSFCEHATGGGGTLAVRDARDDPRFAGNPLVTGAPFIRAYAGAPLIDSEGFGLGALCVIDTRPRDFPARELDILSHLAEAAMIALASHRLSGTLRRTREILAGRRAS
jgi:GAF domain-containing protein